MKKVIHSHHVYGLTSLRMRYVIFRGGGAIFFCRNFFRDYKLCMNFISLVCNTFLCFVSLCTIFTSSTKAVQGFFSYSAKFAPPPPPLQK